VTACFRSDKCDFLECEKRDAERQDDARQFDVQAERCIDVVDEEIRVLEVAEQR